MRYAIKDPQPYDLFVEHGPHTERCLKDYRRYLEIWDKFVTQYPNFCRYCGGWGYTEYTYDPSPAGVALSPGWMIDREPCEHCEEEGKCGLCGKEMAYNEGLDEWTRTCDCPETGAPMEFECFCWAPETWGSEEAWRRAMGLTR